MVSNRRLVEAEGPDFYPTPAWGTLALLRYVTFTGLINEPCCGDGAMAEVLKTAGYPVRSSDIISRGYGSTFDFLKIHTRLENVVTNPPFNVAEDILEHALAITNQKVCLLLRTAFLESKRRYEKFYKARPPTQLLVFTERLSMFPKGYDAKSGGTTSYSWFIWDMTVPQGETRITWIEPGLKR